jgi:hypothetical protein
VKISIKFPVVNRVRIPRPWPIKKGDRTYFIETDNEGFIKAVGVQFTNVPVEKAPTIRPVHRGQVKANITFNGGDYSLLAERDVRAWQSLICAHLLVDINFDEAREEFHPETPEERESIDLPSFGRAKKEKVRSGIEFGILGRAFLAIDQGEPLIELMSFYREGLKALFAERSVDAFNQLYLFLETQFCRGKTGTDQATDELIKNPNFVAALNDAASAARQKPESLRPRFKSLFDEAYDVRTLTKELVELRGKLRHHRLSSPHRWDPNRQEHFEAEARFISLICNNIAFPMTTGKLWDKAIVEQFSTLATEMRMTTEIIVRLTIKRDERLDDVSIKMTLPQPDADAQLARFILGKSLETLDEKEPAAELYAIRAWTKDGRVELFRYDIGPTIGRR